MKLNRNRIIQNQAAGKAGRGGKKMEKAVVWLVVWMFTITLPVWLYGLLLAIGKGEWRPVAAMFVLTSVSGFCCWINIIKPFKAKISARRVRQ